MQLIVFFFKLSQKIGFILQFKSKQQTRLMTCMKKDFGKQKKGFPNFVSFLDRNKWCLISFESIPD